MNDLPMAGIGHNYPPEPIDAAAAMAERDAIIAAVIANANRWLEGHPVIETEEVAGEFLTAFKQIEDHLAEYDELRKAEKKPFDEAVRAVQDKWKPRLEKLEICLKALRPIKSAWLHLKQRRLDQEQAAAIREAAEAQRRADQLAEQAKAGGRAVVTRLAEAAEAAQEAERKRQEAAALPTRAQSRGTLDGRVHSLTRRWFAKVVKQDLVYAHFREHEAVKEVLSRLAGAAVRAANGPRPEGGDMQGINAALPGVFIYSEES